MKTLAYILCCSLLLLNIYDAVATDIILRHGGEELNSWMLFLYNNFGIGGAILFKIIFILLFVIATHFYIMDKMSKRETYIYSSALGISNVLYLLLAIFVHTPILKDIIDSYT